MKIIVDAMGGDNAPDAIVEGAVSASKEHGVDILLVGKTEEILRSLQKLGLQELPRGVEILNATETIEMSDDSIAAVREKRDSSMVVALHQLHEGAGDALVSAGSTGALLSGATLIVKRIRGIRRAALAPLLPGKTGGVLLIDCGANVDCTPEYLLQFAYMGSCYAEDSLGIVRPRIALLNNGTESTKGTELQTATYELLTNEKDSLNFIGNIEGSGIMNGECDVVVCDGFSGNILLKSLEGAIKFTMTQIKGAMTQNTKSKLGALFLKKSFMKLKNELSADAVGGTILLGISKPVIKAHGSSNAKAISAAIRQAKNAANSSIAEKLSENIDKMKVETAE